MTLDITTIVPSTQRLGETVTVTIKGIDFVSPLRVWIQALEPVEIIQLSVVNSTTIIGVVPIGIAKGIYDIRLMLDDGSYEEVTLENAFAVVPAVPSMPFSGETFRGVMRRLLERMSAKYDINEGSTIWDLLAPVAIEVETIYAKLNQFLNLSFLPDSSGSYLDLIGLEHGLTRRAASKAIGVVTIVGTSEVVVSEGFRVSNSVATGGTPVVFVTDEEVTLSLVGLAYTADIAVTAERTGPDGNLPIGEIDTLVSSIAGLSSVTNAAATTGGAYEESDSDFKGRIIRLVGEPTHGGNISDYVKWAQEVDGVGKVGVEPLAGGAGTVSVYILDVDGNPAGAALIAVVQEYIDPTPSGEGGGKAPIGAQVTVAAPSTINTNVISTIVIYGWAVSAEVIAEVEDNLTEYILGLEIGENVRYFEIAQIILETSGVDTISALTVNAGTIDITIGDDEKAVPNTLTITV